MLLQAADCRVWSTARAFARSFGSPVALALLRRRHLTNLCHLYHLIHLLLARG
jgi:hypothetical protein